MRKALEEASADDSSSEGEAQSESGSESGGDVVSEERSVVEDERKEQALFSDGEAVEVRGAGRSRAPKEPKKPKVDRFAGEKNLLASFLAKAKTPPPRPVDVVVAPREERPVVEVDPASFFAKPSQSTLETPAPKVKYQTASLPSILCSDCQDLEVQLERPDEGSQGLLRGGLGQGKSCSYGRGLPAPLVSCEGVLQACGETPGRSCSTPARR